MTKPGTSPISLPTPLYPDFVQAYEALGVCLTHLRETLPTIALEAALISRLCATMAVLEEEYDMDRAQRDTHLATMQATLTQDVRAQRVKVSAMRGALQRPPS